MAITLANQIRINPHGQQIGVYVFTVTFTTGTNYTTNGIAVDLTPLGILFPFSQLQAVLASNNNGYNVYYVKGTNFTNGLFKLSTSGGAELAGATSLNGYILTCVLFAGIPIF